TPFGIKITPLVIQYIILSNKWGAVHNAKGSGFFIFTYPYLLIYHIGKPPVSLDHGTKRNRRFMEEGDNDCFPK
uniref:hypothetical protein n=1 Tax=Anaerotignum lactatifermentans TaxID=160404 RepID=UPI00242D7776